MCWKYFNNKIKKMDAWDVALTKLSVVAFTLFIVSLLSADLLIKILELRWLWLALLVIFAIKPFVKVFSR